MIVISKHLCHYLLVQQNQYENNQNLQSKFNAKLKCHIRNIPLKSFKGLDDILDVKPKKMHLNKTPKQKST